MMNTQGNLYIKITADVQYIFNKFFNFIILIIILGIPVSIMAKPVEVYRIQQQKDINNLRDVYFKKVRSNSILIKSDNTVDTDHPQYQKLLKEYDQKIKGIIQKYNDIDTKSRIAEIKSLKKAYGAGISLTGSLPKDIRADVDITANSIDVTKKIVAGWIKRGDKVKLNRKLGIYINETTDTTLWRPPTPAQLKARSSYYDAFSTHGGKKMTGVKGYEAISDPEGFVLDNMKKFIHAVEDYNKNMSKKKSFRIQLENEMAIKTMGKCLDKAADSVGQDSKIIKKSADLRYYKDIYQTNIVALGATPEQYEEGIKKYLKKVDQELQNADKLAREKSEKIKNIREKLADTMSNSMTKTGTQKGIDVVEENVVDNIRKRIEEITTKNAKVRAANKESRKKAGLPKSPPPNKKASDFESSTDLSRIKNTASSTAKIIDTQRQVVLKLHNMGIDTTPYLTPEMKQAAELSLKLTNLRNTDFDAYESTIKSNFGQPPEPAKLKAYFKMCKAYKNLTKVLEHKVNMLKIISYKGNDANQIRTNALVDLLTKYHQDEKQTKYGRYSQNTEEGKQHKAMISEVAELLEMQKRGQLQNIDQVFLKLKNIFNKPESSRLGVVEFFSKSKGGTELVKPIQKVFEEGKIFLKNTNSLRLGSTMEASKSIWETKFLEMPEGIKNTMATLDYVDFAAQCLNAYTNAVNTDSSAGRAFAEIVVREILSRNIQHFSLVYSGWHAALQGNQKQLGKLLLYYIVPPALIPDLLKGIGNIVISAKQTWIFDDQLESLYQAAVFDPADDKIPDAWNKKKWADAGKTIQFKFKKFKTTGTTKSRVYEGIDGLTEFYLNILNGMDYGTLYKASGSEMQDGITFLKNMTLKPALLAMTVEGNHRLFHRDEGLKQLMAKLTEIDSELVLYELNENHKFKDLAKYANQDMSYQINLLGYSIVLNPTRDTVRNWGTINEKAKRKCEAQIIVEQLVKHRTEVRDKLIKRLAEATVQTFEERKRTDFLLKLSIFEQTIFEQLIDAAKMLHIEKQLPPVVEQLISEQLATYYKNKKYQSVVNENSFSTIGKLYANILETDKAKIHFIVNKWVSTYNQLKNMRKGLINLGLSLGVNKSLLESRLGPLAGIPPLQLDPDKDLITGKRAMQDFGNLANRVSRMISEMAGGNSKPFSLGIEDQQELVRLRFMAMIEEYWFNGPKGASARIWTEFKGKPLSDGEFLTKVKKSLSSGEKWLPSRWKDEARVGYPTHLNEFLTKDCILPYNRLRNKIWSDFQLTLKLSPAHIVLTQGQTGEMLISPMHPYASFKWRINSTPHGLSVLTKQSDEVKPGNRSPWLLKIHADEKIKPGEYKIQLRLKLIQDKQVLKIIGPSGNKIGDKIVEIPITIVESGFVNTDSKTQVTEDQNDTNTTIQSKTEKNIVTISIFNQLDNTPLEGVTVTIISRDGSLTKSTTVAGKVEVLLPPKADCVFELHKTGYNKKVINQKGIDSEELQFKLVPVTNIFTSTPQKQLKFKINPTELLMKTGEQRYISATVLTMKGPAVILKNVTADVAWVPNDPKLISVNEGVVQSVGGAGETMIEATYSISPKIPPMLAICKVRITPKGSNIPRIHIKLAPVKPYYKPGSSISMYAIPEKPGPWKYKWYIGSEEQSGELIHYTFNKPGIYTIALITSSTVDGKEDRISKSIEIREEKPVFDDAQIIISPTPPYTPSATLEMVLKSAEGELVQWKINGKNVKKGQGKWEYTFKDEGSYTIKAELIDTTPKKTFSKTITLVTKAISTPHASQRNRFDKVIKNGNLQIRSSYWKEGKTGFDAAWTKARSFDNIGSTKSAIITTGNQADLYNTGWLVYVPKGKNKVNFKVYGFNFKTKEGSQTYSGSFNLHGKTVVPKSLVFTDVTPYSATVEWRGSDGSLGRVLISKYKPVGGSGGIKELAFTEPRKPIKKKPLVNFKKVAPGVFVYQDKHHRLTVQVESPCEYVLAQVITVNYGGKKGVITRSGNYRSSDSHKKGEGDHYKIFKLDKGTFQLPYPSKADTDKNHIVGMKYYLWYKEKNSKVKIPIRPFQAVAGNTPAKRPLQKIDGLNTTNVPIIIEVVYKSSRWPIRLQDGVLEIQGERQGHYPWYKNWIRLGNNIDDFTTHGTSIGPLVVMRSGSKWSVVQLDYSSGKIRKKYSTSQSIIIKHGGKYGAVLEIGGRCYEFTPHKKGMREVSCRTFMYIGTGTTVHDSEGQADAAVEGYRGDGEIPFGAKIIGEIKSDSLKSKTIVSDEKSKNHSSTGLPRGGKPVAAFGPAEGEGNVLWQNVIKAKERLKNLPKDASKKVKIQYTKEVAEAWRRYNADMKKSSRTKWPTSE